MKYRNLAYFGGFFLILLLCFIFFKKEEKSAVLVRFSGEAQGTYYAISYYDENGVSYQRQVDSILKAFDKVASIWDEGSEINAVNQNKDIELSPTFQDIFFKSQEISELTDGAFDITIGPLAKAYGFWNKNREDITDEKIREYHQLVGYQKLQLKDHKIIKAHPDVQIDFNAIAQGYSVDLLADFFNKLNIENYLIDVGGEIIGKGGKPNGNSWIVGIEEPSVDSESDRLVNTTLELRDAAIVSSGSYRKYYEKDGIRYSHTIDPKTGRSVTHQLLSVSVIDSTAWRADALATAMMVMGVEKSFELLKSLPGVKAYFISASTDSNYLISYSEDFFE